MRSRDLGPLSCLLLALSAFGASTAMAVALAWPETGFARSLGLSPVHEARAHARAAGTRVSGDDLAAAREETMLGLRLAPANATGWLRLAYLDSLRPEGFGLDGNRALAASYAVAPFGPDDTAWRLVFAFNHWTRLTRSNRLAALDELRVTQDRTASRLSSAVDDPAGRVALLLTLDDIRRRRIAPNSALR